MPVIAPRHAIAAVYAGLFFGIGVFVPFFPVWLQHRGFDAAMIALALAIPQVVRLVTMPLGGLLADHSGRPRATLIGYSLGTALCFVFIALAPGATFILVALGVVAAFWQPSLPVLDAYAVARRREGLVDYGRVRLWGSMAFIGGNLVAGGLLAGLAGPVSHDAVIWLIVAGSVAAALAASALREASPLPRPAKAPADRRPRRAFGGLAPVLLVGMVAAALVQSSHAALYAFASIEWHSKGLSDGTIGLLWSLGVLAEVVLFHFGTRVTHHLGPERLLLLGGLAGLLRFAAMALDPPLLLLLLLQPLHALTFGCTYLGTVELVARHAPPGRGASVQGIAACATAIAMAGATLVSGPLWQSFGAQTFLVSAGLATAGALLALACASMRADQPHSAGSGG
ncbi:MFS transporter [Ancylobacter sp. TS-1]|uniref:MFS transporter n=1 Tax=Ancylobacter sp. TS-1 TaxID=1850374 RepID=UPI001265CBF3|nr:MFS transporter [Ancylobacter sp. TS-1]QFR32607.1 MFS transporter [Ancylobacter sp. TS-1]